MKKTFVILSALVAIGSFTGCVGQNATKGFVAMGANLAKDHALFIVDNKLMTPWGQQNSRIVRVGDLTNTVTVSPEGVVTVNAQAKQ